MRHPITDADRRKVETALRKISEVIAKEYPEDSRRPSQPEMDFRWGLGDGFRLALRGVIDAALPDWKDR